MPESRIDVHEERIAGHHRADARIPPPAFGDAQQPVHNGIVDRIELFRTIEPDVQHAFAKEAIEAYGASFGKLSEAFTASVKDAAEAIGDRARAVYASATTR